jgi:hypothetical protein
VLNELADRIENMQDVILQIQDSGNPEEANRSWFHIQKI